MKILRWIAIGVLGLIVLIQFIPPIYIWQTNPPVVQEPAWDSMQTRDIARRACFDCHSNETVWPLYSKIAPVSWLVTRDVVDGREALNFSEWNTGSEEADEIIEVVMEGEMPMAIYLPMHPEAKLTAAERQQFIDGMRLTLAASGISSESGGEQGEQSESGENE